MRWTMPIITYILSNISDMRNVEFLELSAINCNLENFVSGKILPLTKERLHDIFHIIGTHGGYLHSDVDDFEDATPTQLEEKWIPIHFQLGDECMVSIIGYSVKDIMGDWKRVGSTQ
jgi:hypothetical protein